MPVKVSNYIKVQFSVDSRIGPGLKGSQSTSTPASVLRGHVSFDELRLGSRAGLGNRREDIFLDDVDRHDFIKTLAEACQKAGELGRLGRAERDLAVRRKSDPDKLVIAARLRRETTLAIKAIAAIAHLGSSKGANGLLHRQMTKLASQIQPHS